MSNLVQRELTNHLVRHPAKATPERLMWPYLIRPIGRPFKSGIRVKLVDFRYRAKTGDRERRLIAKIEWHEGQLFPRI